MIFSRLFESQKLTHAAFALVTATLALSTPTVAGANEPNNSLRIVATIKPLHGLVAGVMKNVPNAGSSPELLVSGVSSPHHFSLSPSHARLLERADIIFSTGKLLMRGVADAIGSIASKAEFVDLSQSPGVQLLAIRSTHDRGKSHAYKNSRNYDPHFWLDPKNATHMLDEISGVLTKFDPPHADLYMRNAGAMKEKITTLIAQTTTSLAPYRDKSFFLFHDGFQYFEKRFGLIPAGWIAANPEQRPGPKHIRVLRKQLESIPGACVFSEPGTPVSLIRVLRENRQIQTAILDPLGRNFRSDSNHYFNMLEDLERSFQKCLSR